MNIRSDQENRKDLEAHLSLEADLEAERNKLEKGLIQEDCGPTPHTLESKWPWRLRVNVLQL